MKLYFDDKCDNIHFDTRPNHLYLLLYLYLTAVLTTTTMVVVVVVVLWNEKKKIIFICMNITNKYNIIRDFVHPWIQTKPAAFP